MIITIIMKFSERNDVLPTCSPAEDSARNTVSEVDSSSPETRITESTPEWLDQWLLWVEQAEKPRVPVNPLGDQCEDTQGTDPTEMAQRATTPVIPSESVCRRNPSRRARPPTSISVHGVLSLPQE